MHARSVPPLPKQERIGATLTLYEGMPVVLEIGASIRAGFAGQECTQASFPLIVGHKDAKIYVGYECRWDSRPQPLLDREGTMMLHALTFLTLPRTIYLQLDRL